MRYEVDRIRNGRSFVTRRVVARQAIGAILNAECSLHRHEASPALQTLAMPHVDAPESVENSSFSAHFDRRRAVVDAERSPRDGLGRSSAWMRLLDPVDADDVVLHQAWLAFISDDLPTDAVRSARLQIGDGVDGDQLYGVSLDHTIWFHRPIRADRWHLHDMSCHHYSEGRGLALGHVFDEDGLHVATVAQEVLVRTRRDTPG